MDPYLLPPETLAELLHEVWAPWLDVSTVGLWWESDRDSHMLTVYDWTVTSRGYFARIETPSRHIDRELWRRQWFENADRAMCVALQLRHFHRAHQRGGYA